MYCEFKAEDLNNRYTMWIWNCHYRLHFIIGEAIQEGS